MAIVFRLAHAAAELLAFSYSPSLDAVLSLHVLVEPKHHPAQHPWVRSSRSLPPELKREIAAFAFAYRFYFPEFPFPEPTGEMLDFEAELARVRRTDPGLAGLEFAIPLADRLLGRDPAALDDAQVRAGIRRRAREMGDGTSELAELCLDEPAELLERFAALLGRYWEAAFSREWERIEPQLAESVSEAGRQIGGDPGWNRRRLLRYVVSTRGAEGSRSRS